MSATAKKSMLNEPTRAKSRLKRPATQYKKIADGGELSKNDDVALTKKQTKSANSPTKWRLSDDFSLLERYQVKLPTLVVGGIFSALTFALVTTIKPAAIQHIIFENSYLPFLVLIFLSTFFLASYLFLHSRRGYFASLAITLTVWIQITQFYRDWLFLPLFGGIFIAVELLCSRLERLSSRLSDK